MGTEKGVHVTVIKIRKNTLFENKCKCKRWIFLRKLKHRPADQRQVQQQVKLIGIQGHTCLGIRLGQLTQADGSLASGHYADTTTCHLRIRNFSSVTMYNHSRLMQ